MIRVGQDGLITVSAIARRHGFEQDDVCFDPDAWRMVIAWDRTTPLQPDGSLVCDAGIIQRIANVLRWMRPALRRGKPHATTGQLQAHFITYYAFPKDNPVSPGDKHCPLRVVFDPPDASPRVIVIVLNEHMA
jgi:hypothetical protein